MPHATVRAPELVGGIGWLNTDKPLRLNDLKGKVVLLDFWTFCCINCMHVMPDLKKLEAKYPRELVVIGVHSAKFDNEKDSDNIRRAILRYGIEHPVVNDADFKIWQAYAVRSWPTLVVIDPDGRVAGQVSGEGQLDVLDHTIAQLIESFDHQGKIDRKELSFHLEKSKTAQTPLSFPGKILADATGKRLFISDSGHNRIVVVDASGKREDVIGSGSQGAKDGDFDSASFNHPQGLALKDGMLYIADTENHMIRKADLLARTVSTSAGTGKQSVFRAGGGPARTTALSSPWDLVFAGDKIYIAMAGPHQLWVFDPATNEVHPYAGSGREDITDGPLAFAALAQPSGITTDGGKLYFADSEVSAVRSAGLEPGGKVETIVGEGLFDFGDKDGPAAKARLQHPLGVTYLDGTVFVADSYNHKIKAIDPRKAVVKSLVGSGKAGLADGKPGQLSEPGGLTALGRKIYIADTNNHAVRVVDLDQAELKTLPITGLEAPLAVVADASATSADTVKTPLNAARIAYPESVIKAQAPGQIVIDAQFPSGFHLNPEASLTYNLVGYAGSAVKIEKSHFAGKIHPPVLPLAIPVAAGASGEVTRVSLAVSLYYCSSGANAICKMKSLLLDVPVRTDDSAKSSVIKLDVKLTE